LERGSKEYNIETRVGGRCPAETGKQPLMPLTSQGGRLAKKKKPDSWEGEVTGADRTSWCRETSTTKDKLSPRRHLREETRRETKREVEKKTGFGGKQENCKSIKPNNNAEMHAALAAKRQNQLTLLVRGRPIDTRKRMTARRTIQLGKRGNERDAIALGIM